MKCRHCGNKVLGDAKYCTLCGNLVDGAKMLQLFGDVATELLILNDGDEGLFKAYTDIEFMAPVFAGDYIEAVGEITEVGNHTQEVTAAIHAEYIFILLGIIAIGVAIMLFFSSRRHPELGLDNAAQK